jgi:hypothetical protein
MNRQFWEHEECRECGRLEQELERAREAFEETYKRLESSLVKKDDKIERLLAIIEDRNEAIAVLQDVVERLTRETLNEPKP